MHFIMNKAVPVEPHSINEYNYAPMSAARCDAVDVQDRVDGKIQICAETSCKLFPIPEANPEGRSSCCSVLPSGSGCATG